MTKIILCFTMCMNDGTQPDPIIIPREALTALVDEVLGPVVGLRLSAPDERGIFAWTALSVKSGVRVSGTFVVNFSPSDDGINMGVTATVDGAS